MIGTSTVLPARRGIAPAWMRSLLRAPALRCVAACVAAIVPFVAPVSVDAPATPASAAASHFPPADPAARSAGVRATLDARAEAVLRRDRSAFLAGVDERDRAFVRRQERLFEGLVQLRFSSWAYSADERYAYPLDDARAARYDGQVYLPALTLRYAVAGYHQVPVARALVYTFVERNGRWLIAGDTDLEHLPIGATAKNDAWDVDDIRVVEGQRSLVIGSRQDAGDLALIAAEADAAVSAVTDVWGTGWAQQVIVTVVRDEALFASILRGSGFGAEGIAAVAVPERPDVYNRFAPTPAAAMRTVGARVVVNPDYFDPADEDNAQLLRHEVAHVATMPSSGRGMPEWLVEGFAEYVGNLPLDFAVDEIAPELADAVDLGDVPHLLPGVSDFADPDRALLAYEQSWLACRYVADRFGQPALLRLYRRFATLNDPARTVEATPGILREVLGVSEPDFLEGWSGYLRSELSAY